ncbi:ABC transporter substrate-binding protein [Pseudorhodoferax sp. Leaf274]|uniref:ABC transporter substrate-binding protein n=1 Tax=Pseudorhodoferax sp. Leaf274 TaxID=1736318 RepID=UPI001F291A80|nr:ABC transporter substrate-binding protein [Pseudorhodoferax sp. Leaf274]
MNLDAACVADYRPGVDYFPDKLAFSYSTQLTVAYGPHFKRVWFRPSVVAGEVQEYLLVQCGTPAPPHGPHVQVVHVPVQRLVTGNSAMLGALDELGLVDRLFGSESTRSATVPSVRERVARGLVQDMWGHGHASIEPVIAAQPDVYLSFYSAYPQGNMHPRLWELGVRAIAQADHHETHPLGRAEWLKLLALLGNREALANTQFAHIASEYARWREIASQAGTRPDVLAGFASGRATMETFGGHNQRAQLIHDAGGRYVLDDVESPSSLVYLPFEMVYVRGAQAPVWLGTLGGRASVQSLLEANTLHGWFAAAQAGRVYAWDRGYTGAWAYPYQDQGMTRPHVQLAEAVVALHPELLHLAGAPVPPAPQFLRKLP